MKILGEKQHLISNTWGSFFFFFFFSRPLLEFFIIYYLFNLFFLWFCFSHISSPHILFLVHVKDHYFFSLVLSFFFFILLLWIYLPNWQPPTSGKYVVFLCMPPRDMEDRPKFAQFSWLRSVPWELQWFRSRPCHGSSLSFSLSFYLFLFCYVSLVFDRIKDAVDM